MISKLQITVSDPWEFCEDNGGSSIFIAKLIDCKDDGILFYSDNPIILRSKTEKKEWHNFWGTPRYAEKITEKIGTKDGCSCNIVALVSEITSISEAKKQVSRWRGGGAMLAMCSLVEHESLVTKPASTE